VKYLKENPPTVEELSPFRRAEKSVNRILEEYPDMRASRNLPPFNSLVRTILSQNTSSNNTVKAYTRLSEQIGLDPYSISEASKEDIIKAIKPSGMYNQKTQYLKKTSEILVEKYDGDIETVFEYPFNEARDRLMELPGVGPKTADVSLMFSANSRVVPVDRHIERIAKRLEIVEDNAGYEEIRSAWQDAATPDRFRELHLALIKFGREVCKARNPDHDTCILRDICPYAEKNMEEKEHDEGIE
jgi:endonuclease-3